MNDEFLNNRENENNTSDGINPQQESSPVSSAQVSDGELPSGYQTLSAEKSPVPEEEKLPDNEEKIPDNTEADNASAAAYTADGQPACEAAPEPENPQNDAPSEPAPAEIPPQTEGQIQPPVWTFSEQLTRDRKTRKKAAQRGTLIYALVVSLLFIFSFGMLMYVMSSGFSSGAGSSSKKTYVDRTVYIREDDGTSGLLTTSEVAAKVMPSTVGISVKTTGGSGEASGVIMSEDGYIITNYHVIEDAESVNIILYDGSEFGAEIIGGDELSDLALLKINPGKTKLTAATFGDSDAILLGEDVIAIGNPAGLDYYGTVTKGIISCASRDVKVYASNGLLEKTMTLIQTDVTLNFGNSGGPLVNFYGEVIGICNMKLAQDYDNICFAIPSNSALTVINEIKENGTYSGSGDVAKKGVSLGVNCYDVTEGQKYQFTENGPEWTAPKTGVMVWTIASDESSASGYLEPYDVITAVNGKTVTGTVQIREVLVGLSSGDTVTLTVYRSGSETEVVIPLK